MKIATWNVNSIRMRLAQVLDWLNENHIDVLCLQETKVSDADFPRSPFLDQGYHLYIWGQKSYNGVALVSRTPLTEVSAGFAPILTDPAIQTEALLFDEQKRVITGVVAPGIRVVNLYVPNGGSLDSEKYVYKLRWLSLLQQYLQTLRSPDQPLLICGDFNIALEDRDIHNPEGRETQVMATDREREALRAILALGLADAFRKFNGNGGQFSWWDYRAAAFRRNLGWRIDHHYLSAELYAQAIACTIDKTPRKLTQPSDHAPVVVELEV